MADNLIDNVNTEDTIIPNNWKYADPVRNIALSGQKQ